MNLRGQNSIALKATNTSRSYRRRLHPERIRSLRCVKGLWRLSLSECLGYSRVLTLGRPAAQIGRPYGTFMTVGRATPAQRDLNAGVGVRRAKPILGRSLTLLLLLLPHLCWSQKSGELPTLTRTHQIRHLTTDQAAANERPRKSRRSTWATVIPASLVR
jgi:hypothetical protein